MLDVIEYITARLREVHARVYLEHAPEKKVFPYVIWHSPSSSELDYREDFTVVVDVWDNQTDNTALETIAHAIDKKLHRTRFLSDDGKVQLSIFRQSRNMVPNPDPAYRRRQLRYRVKAYLI